MLNPMSCLVEELAPTPTDLTMVMAVLKIDLIIWLLQQDIERELKRNFKKKKNSN